jgi:hypothetical protein
MNRLMLAIAFLMSAGSAPIQFDADQRRWFG